MIFFGDFNEVVSEREKDGGAARSEREKDGGAARRIGGQLTIVNSLTWGLKAVLLLGKGEL